MVIKKRQLCYIAAFPFSDSENRTLSFWFKSNRHFKENTVFLGKIYIVLFFIAEVIKNNDVTKLFMNYL